jgi:BCD family chlorophyll transporter-like MFS transporter
VIRDVALAASGQFSVAYASVFLIEAAGLLVCIWLLVRVDVPAFARQARVRSAELLAAVE